MQYQILTGDNRHTLKTLADNSIDAIVTDPPYGIDFLGKAWDANTGALETYQECLRVLKPGGHILAFSAARTYHHLAITLEQAGFEIRDQIMWIYSSGFPKSQDIGKSIARSEEKVKNTKTYLPVIDDNRNVSNSTTGSPRCQMCDKSTGPIWKKCPDDRADCIRPWEPDLQNNEWNGWGTQLKPAHEPIALARKPIKLSIAKNCQQWGVGALNIDATRIPTDDVLSAGAGNAATFTNFNAENNVDGPGRGHKINKDVEKWEQNTAGRFPSNVVGEIPDYQKYFYCPKVSRRERHIGFPVAKGMYEIAREHGYTLSYDDPNDTSVGYMVDTLGNKVPDLVLQKLVEQHGGGNNHPTVKPIELMKYLIRLVTPPGGTVLDPFNGSGSTGCAAVELGMTYIGCELDPAYVAIARSRIEAWYALTHPLQATGLFE
jgi:site-specific DNA-methyltransferase (adenine-specific)